MAPDLEQKFWIYPVDGGQPRALSGIEPGEIPIRWSADGKYLFVAAAEGIPVVIYRTEVSTGRRQFVSIITPDGRSYVYSDYRILSDLYLASGLR